jgi:predicted amidohydrolase
MTRIALFQSTTGIDPAANAQRLIEAIEKAADGGAEMLFTPEMSGLLDRDSARAAKVLTSQDEDRVLGAVREAAAKHRIWLHVGSLAVLVNGTPIGKLGLTICYDLRFPGLFARLAESDADVIAVPAAFTVPTGKAHWHVLLRARAIEAGLFVVAAAQTGHHEDGRNTFGHSLVIDPWGEVLLDMGEEPGIAFADIDLKRIVDVRSRIPALNHRRPIPDSVTL